MIKDIMRDELFLQMKSLPATKEDKGIADDLLDTLKANAMQCVCLLYTSMLSDSSNDYAKGMAKSFKKKFKEKGGEIVTELNYAEKDTDFNVQLTKIKDMDFDVLYIPGYYNEVGLIIKQARSLGIDVPIIGGDGFDSSDLVKLAGAENLNDVYFTTAYTCLLYTS